MSHETSKKCLHCGQPVGYRVRSYRTGYVHVAEGDDPYESVYCSPTATTVATPEEE
jgi:hypothetical protein